jgi:hypothetical protein
MIVAFHTALLMPHRFDAYLEAFKAFLVKGAPHFSRQDNFILRPNSFWRPSAICDSDASKARRNRGAYARHSASASRATSARREAREVIS